MWCTLLLWRQGYTNHRHKVTMGIKFCMVASRILRWPIDIWKICASLHWGFSGTVSHICESVYKKTNVVHCYWSVLLSRHMLISIFAHWTDIFFSYFYVVMVTNIVFWTPQCLCLWWWCWNGCLCCIAVELFGGIEMHVSHFAQICVWDKYVKV